MKESKDPTYIQLTSTGYLHLISDEGKTACGIRYRQYDYLTYNEIDPNKHALCRRCSGQRREGPQTIREAFRPGAYEQQMTGYERRQQAILNQMNQSKPPLEGVQIPSKNGSSVVRRKVTNKENFGRGCERAQITHNNQTVAVYRRDDQIYWSLDMSVVL